jgi:hypothetical protein
MKLVREYIVNETFTDESDPIQDMGIGMIHKIREFCKDRMYPTSSACKEIDILLLICIDKHNYDFVKYLLDMGANVHTSGGIHEVDKDLPLRHAAYYDCVDIAKLLISYGATFEKSLDDQSLKTFIKEKRFFSGHLISDEIIKLVEDEYENSQRNII